MTLSPQQQTVIDAWQSGHVSVDSCAGSGKTTTLIECVSATPYALRTAGIALAFGRRNADELKAKVPYWTDANTFHSVGKRAIESAMGRVKVNKNKVWEILRSLDCNPFALDKSEQKKKLAEHKEADHLVSMGKALLCTPSQYVSAAELEDEYSEMVISLADQAYNASTSVTHGINFDDMIWFPSIHNEVANALPRASVLFVDEVQDLSPAQSFMVERMTGERVAMFGDPNQAIYGFRGADGTALRQLAVNFSAQQLRLSVSFRCPKAITTFAQQYVPDITADPSAPDGLLEIVKEIDFSWWGSSYPTVICRYNAPLVEIALQLISRNIRATIRGRAVGEGLLKLLDKLQDYGITTLSTFRSGFQSVLQEMSQNKSADRKKDLKDNFRILEVIFRAHPDDPQRVRSMISSLFSDDSQAGGAVLSTVHRFKGLEDRHIIWFRAEGDNGPEQSEINCRYVACTRAKERLTIIQPEGVEE